MIDSQGEESEEKTGVIGITGRNNAPFAVDIDAETTEDDALASQIEGAIDIDGSIAAYNVKRGPERGVLSMERETGAYTFDPAGDFDGLGEGDKEEITFTYTVTDDDGAESEERLVTLTVKGRNDAPVVSGPCLLYTSPSPRDATLSRMPSSA